MSFEENWKVLMEWYNKTFYQGMWVQDAGPRPQWIERDRND